MVRSEIFCRKRVIYIFPNRALLFIELNKWKIT
jgi:hypothetical protein